MASHLTTKPFDLAGNSKKKPQDKNIGMGTIRQLNQLRHREKRVKGKHISGQIKGEQQHQHIQTDREIL